MSIIKKVRKIGTSLGIPIPTDSLKILDIDADAARYYFRADEDGRVFISVLPLNVKKIEERKFVKTGSTFGIIIPNTLVSLWGVSVGDEIEIKLNKQNLNELQISPVK